MQQQTTETSERPYSIKTQYKAGLRARMREYAHGRARRWTALTTVDDADPAAQAFTDGYRDAEDDSDDPRPDDAAALQAMAFLIYEELERVCADVSAWPDMGAMLMRLDDGLMSERHEPEALLSVLRGLPDGGGAFALWEATKAIAVSCINWGACAVVTDAPAAAHAP